MRTTWIAMPAGGGLLMFVFETVRARDAGLAAALEVWEAIRAQSSPD